MFKNLDELLEELDEKKIIKFKIKACANARSESIDFCEEIIKIKIMAPAIEGKANKAIIEYISRIMGVPKSKVKIINGEKASIKTICIQL